MISVNITAESAADFFKDLSELAAGFGAAPASGETAPEPTKTPARRASRSTATETAKADVAPDPEAPVQTEKPKDAPKEPRALKIDDLSACMLDKNVERSKKIALLAEYGVEKAGELEEKEWPKFVADYAKLLPEGVSLPFDLTK